MIHIALSILFVSQPVKKPATSNLKPPTISLPVSIKPPQFLSVVLPIPKEPPSPAPIAKLDYISLPHAPIGTFVNDYPLGQCTEGVASMKGNIPNWGNASDWAERARADGYTVSSIPVVGSVAQKGGGEGHVALVVAIDGDQVKVTEENYDWNGSIRDYWYPASDFNYIYI